ncbi:MAG: ABC transporter ATP-binding protein/permease [Mollicutes bacterium]|nr:ABC transporter ATP-binding protein/permease [Mollicutes bacterium]MDY6070042.1 ABC transporter ATP-binding protein [Bacilli bacterium]
MEKTKEKKIRKTLSGETRKYSTSHTLKVLSKHIKGFWKDAILTWGCVILETALEILIAFFIQFLLEQVRINNINGIILWACIIAGMAVLAAVLGVLAGYWASSASAGFGRNLRQSMFEKVQDYSFKNIDKFSPSSIVTRTTTDVTNVQFSFMMTIRMVLRAPLMMLFALIMCFIMAPGLAWIFLIIIPLVLFVLLFIASKAHRRFVLIFNTYDDLNESVEEDVDGIRVVKSFDRKSYHVSHFNKVSDFIYKNYVANERLLSFNNPFMNFAIFTAMILISILGSKIITSNVEVVNSLNGLVASPVNLTVESLSSLFTYVMMIFMALMMVSMVYVMITIARNSAERIVEILDEVPDIRNNDHPIMEVPNGNVDFNHVSFGYAPGKYVLNDVDLHFKEGETVGIIGPTGSSKTSLVSLMARLYDVNEGDVEIGGIDVRDYDIKTLRDAVSVVLQKNVLFTGTIRDNLKWGNENASDEEIWAACDLAQASEFLHTFPKGLDTPITEGGTNVSGGQKQRLCIARALLKNPKILILDDSTSACDTHTDSLIREGLAKTKPNVTKFIIAQRVLSIKDCDTILVLESGGKIVDKGNNDELMKRCSVYKELYESQLGGGDFDVHE